MTASSRRWTTRRRCGPAAERCSHDYVCHGITTLFALNVATGEITGSIHRGHRAAEFKKFLTTLDTDIPADLDSHLICDNDTTYKSPMITGWLARYPRFHLHFTPTYSSWLIQVERWFGVLTDKHCAAAPTPACQRWR